MTREQIELTVIRASVERYFQQPLFDTRETVDRSRRLIEDLCEAFIEKPPVSDARDPQNLESALRYILQEALYVHGHKDIKSLAHNTLTAIIDRAQAALREGPYAERGR